jgi:DNA-binding MurR/RpiR family transcriptional regulator
VDRLGFKGFPDFQKHLREELEAQIKSPLAKASPQSQQNNTSPLARFAEAVLDNLKATVGNIAPAEFDAVVALLSDRKRRIHFTGGRFTGAIARYAAVHLRIVRSDVDVIESEAALWRDQVIEIDKRDVIVVFDIRRYQDDIIALAEIAAEQGASIVLLTDQWLSPVARVAKHTLPAHVEAPSNWDSSAGLLLIAETLIAEVTKQLWETAKPRMEAIERLRQGK